MTGKQDGKNTMEMALRDFLLKNNCHIAQGFYYAKPLGENELLAYMEKLKRDNG